MDDLFENPNDKMETDPADLGPIIADVLTITLAKQLAGKYEKPWTDKLESEMQAKISALVAAAKGVASRSSVSSSLGQVVRRSRESWM
jgi:hypothetical protein